MDNQNMDNQIIGCRTNKTIVIEPNNLDNQGLYSNLSVSLEDLSIYVQLETTKRARTLLTSNGKGDLSKSSKSIKVSFIEGSDINGTKTLTSRYTDLNTSLDNDNDNESLGITSIDIDFNTSYAPQVVINFIDLRGSSIFQNESILTNSNKYSTLFDLPYPIFKLTIKGYYGMKVSYDLHLTKFTSKFNSKTGNFEITANFIGYTYALLSDMIIGYLRAIGNTDKGKDVYKKFEDEGRKVMNIDEFIQGVSKIDSGIAQLASNDNRIKKYQTYINRYDIISDLYKIFIRLGNLDSYNKDLEEYKFIFFNSGAYYNIYDTKNIDKDNDLKTINEYNENIDNFITSYNDNNDLPLDKNVLNFDKIIKYENLTNSIFDNPENETLLHRKIVDDGGLPESEYISTVNKIKEHINKYQIKGSFDVYDLNSLYRYVADKKTELGKSIDTSKTDIGIILKSNIATSLNGLNPSVRNIVEIFTTAVEVFMTVLFNVSIEAQTNEDRKKQLTKYKPTKNLPNESQLDYKYNSSNEDGNKSAVATLDTNYYPWPEYRKKDDKLGLIEEYLGSPGVLTKPDDVIEIKFINELFDGFIKSAKQQDALTVTEQKLNTTWGAINPLDTEIFGILDYPYNRISKINVKDYINLILIRGFLSMSISNAKLTESEIDLLAQSESNLILLDSDDKIKNAISNLTIDDFKKSTGSINGLEVPIMKELFGNYYYNFIFGNNEDSSINDLDKYALLPINTINNTLDYNIDKNNTIQSYHDGILFINNYTTSTYINSDTKTKIKKPDDGSIFIKLLNPNDYNASSKNVNTSQPNTNILSLDTLSKETSDFLNGAEFSFLSGKYGIQEYFKVNLGYTGLENADYRLIFFADSTDDERISNSFCPIREKDKIFGKDLVTIYDNTNEWVSEVKSKDDFNLYTLSVHKNIGKNRFYLQEYINNKKNITYPYICFESDFKQPISLFGSTLYTNNKDNIYSRCFLFLHTLPWNGLTGKNIKGIFSVNEILNTFASRAGFISVPSLWVSFIGGLLWRAEDNDLDPIILDNNYSSPFIENTKMYYLKAEGSKFSLSFLNWNNLIPIEELLFQLPEQVKNEFKKAFFNFAENEFNELDASLYIKNQDFYSSTFKTFERTLADETIQFTNKFIDDNDKKNYTVITKFQRDDLRSLKGNLHLEIKDNSDISIKLMKLIASETIITNTTFRIWQKDNIQDKSIFDIFKNGYFKNGYFKKNKYLGVYVKTSDMDRYINKILTNIKPIVKTEQDKNKQYEQNIFGTDNENIIKFQLYRTCKNIYDKWVANSTESTIIFKDGNEFRNGLDKNLSKDKYKSLTVRLIDSFRFVSRSFRDIGDELYINPKSLSESIKNNPGISFYNLISSLLASNKFDFIALPNYINYGDVDELNNIFRPVSTEESFKSGSTGPSFVCVYTGQGSKHLDFKDSEYPNDGVDFQCDKKKQMITNIPADFTLDAKTYENNVAVFSVNYSQQNQNIFKDITLDQNEFTETEESLKITDDIAQIGSSTYGGQNLYNVYSVRSYKSEVEMMGNAMIQPMMYYQLNNIPMFHGAYLITQVKHSIRPNNMSTIFSGVRIRNVETPLLDAATLYLPLLDTLTSNEKQPTLSYSIENGLSPATIVPGKDIKCNTVKKTTLDFNDLLKIIIDNIEGSYCPGGLDCGSKNSGETLWGLDRKNHDKSKLIDDFWKLVDEERKKSKIKWKYNYPKPNDYANSIFKTYAKIIKTDYDNFSNNSLKNSVDLKHVIESDGRLYFNMIYAVLNGAGYFDGFSKILKDKYNSGITTSDKLLRIFVDERIFGGYNAIKYLSNDKVSPNLIANGGVKIEKLVGISKECTNIG